MKLAGFEEALPKKVPTGLKINISWQTWYPACSSRLADRGRDPRLKKCRLR